MVMTWLLFLVKGAINIRCRNCGRECVLQSSQSLIVAENTFQTARKYKCPKCKRTYEIVDDPVEIRSEQL